MMRQRFPLLAGTLVASATLAVPAQADDPRVVSSILPIHGLVAGLVDDVMEADVLLPPDASPHGYSMRPSEARRLQNADVVVWVGPDLETFLESPLRNRGEGTTVVTLMEDMELDLLPTRSGGVWEPHDHDHDHDAAHDETHEEGPGDDHDHGHDHDHDHDHDHGHDHAHGHQDAHIWLSPDNARAIVTQLADRLGENFPDKADALEDNRDRMLERIDALDTELKERLEPISDEPFVVFHDAYQYFETHYGLNAAGSITIDPSRSPGSRRIHELRERLSEDDVACLFTEPQFRPALAETIVEGHATRLGQLDPVGVDIRPGPDAWFELMEGLADGFLDCMKRE